MSAPTDFGKKTAEQIRSAGKMYETATSGGQVDGSLREQVLSDLEKLAKRRESGNLN
jgi:hypothetical protein